MNAETDGERRQALGFELTIERFARRLGEKGPPTCSFDIVGLQMGRISCQAPEGTRSLLERLFDLDRPDDLAHWSGLLE